MGFEIPEWLRYEIIRWWERLELRRRINRNPGLVIRITIAAVLILFAITGSLMFGGRKTVAVDKSPKAWFYDLNTGKLFTAKNNLVPPIEAPSGPLLNGRPAGVRAYVFSFVPEPNESELFIGFLEKSDPNAGPAPANSEAEGSKLWGQGRLIRLVEDKEWYQANSREGRDILRRFFNSNRGPHRVYFISPD